MGTVWNKSAQSLTKLTKLPIMLSLFVACAALSQAQQSRLIRPEKSPTEVVERVWKLATQGELLTPEGWDKVARQFFVHPAPLSGSKVILLQSQGDKVIQVVSNDWSVLDETIEGKKAKVTVEYYDAGRIDSTLHYAPGREPDPIGKTQTLYALILAPTYTVMSYKSDVKSMAVDKVIAGSPAYQIESPQGPPWTTVNTAIRYVLEMRNKTTDPAIKKNADETLTKLLRLH